MALRTMAVKTTALRTIAPRTTVPRTTAPRTTPVAVAAQVPVVLGTTQVVVAAPGTIPVPGTIQARTIPRRTIPARCRREIQTQGLPTEIALRT